ncbi:hypothetical protein OUZ56_033017 [Daphnia magna]|uniref:Uncharacterized protein n=1 Tax=Daphnia magna TaxID=35525 RepID=A0ABR0BA04_9CRUS|nr:hypothetical protein OUZ56_033017 [Daphnia magna]
MHCLTCTTYGGRRVLKRPSGVAARSPLDMLREKAITKAQTVPSLVIVDYNEVFKLLFAVGICLVKQDSSYAGVDPIEL